MRGIFVCEEIELLLVAVLVEPFLINVGHIIHWFKVVLLVPKDDMRKRKSQTAPPVLVREERMNTACVGLQETFAVRSRRT